MVPKIAVHINVITDLNCLNLLWWSLWLSNCRPLGCTTLLWLITWCFLLFDWRRRVVLRMYGCGLAKFSYSCLTVVFIFLFFKTIASHVCKNTNVFSLIQVYISFLDIFNVLYPDFRLGIQGYKIWFNNSSKFYAGKIGHFQVWIRLSTYLINCFTSKLAQSLPLVL